MGADFPRNIRQSAMGRVSSGVDRRGGREKGKELACRQREEQGGVKDPRHGKVQRPFGQSIQWVGLARGRARGRDFLSCLGTGIAPNAGITSSRKILSAAGAAPVASCRGRDSAATRRASRVSWGGHRSRAAGAGQMEFGGAGCSQILGWGLGG